MSETPVTRPGGRPHFLPITGARRNARFSLGHANQGPPHVEAGGRETGQNAHSLSSKESGPGLVCAISLVLWFFGHQFVGEEEFFSALQNASGWSKN